MLKKRLFIWGIWLLSVSPIWAQAPNESVFTPANFPVRALWVTRWDYRTPDDIAAIVKNAEWAGFTVLFFQVRGNGTVFYHSNFEPLDRALQVSGTNWDPLAYAVARAHLSGLELHAWVNIFPGWRGTRPPADPEQLWNRYRSWFLPLGKDFLPALRSGYAWLNPALPQVQTHLKTLVFELSEDYNLDGIHFDYFRYPGPGDFVLDSQNPVYRSLFHFQNSNVREWDAFRRKQLSNFAESCRRYFKRIHPRLTFSVAIFGDRDIGTRAFFQDSRRWMWNNTFTYVVPMTYTSDTLQFGHWLNFYRTYPSQGVLPGILTQSPSAFWAELAQIKRHGFPGFSFFSYQALFPGHVAGPLAHELSAHFFAGSNPKPHLKEASLAHLPYPERLSFSGRGFPFVGKQKVVVEWNGSLPPDGRFSLDWKRKRAGAFAFTLPLVRRKRYPNQLITSRAISFGPRAGLYCFSLYQIEDKKRIELRQFEVPFLTGPSRFHFVSFWGEPIQGACHVLIDRQKQVWIPAGDHLVVLDSLGRQTRFSPIWAGRNSNGKRQNLHKSLGICQDGTGTIWVTSFNGKGHLLGFTEQGRSLTGIDLPFFPGDVTVDSLSRFFILSAENTHWHVVSPEGTELPGSPISGTHRSYGIAVSPGATSVFVSCRADGKVHHWAGGIFREQAAFQQLTDLDVGDTGFGSLFLDNQGRLFVCQPGLGRIVVWDTRHYRLVDVIANAMIRAPRAIAHIPDTRDYLILETSGETAVRLVRVREE